jgi:hypothetical protein
VRQFNVTGLVQARVSNGDDWMGFNLTRSNTSTRNPDTQSFDISGSDRVKLTLTYVVHPVDVTVHLGGLGQGTVTSNPTGIDCGDTCMWWFEYSEPLTLTANPQNGGTFSHWDGGDCDGSTDPVCSFLVPATFFEATAVFDPIGPPISAPPNATPAPTAPQLTPPPSAKASTGPVQTLGPGETVVAPTDVIASDGTVITPAPPTQAAVASGAAPTIVGLDEGDAGAPGGGVPLPLLIVLILILGAAVGGGVYWYTKRQQASAGP